MKHWLSISPRNAVTVLDTHDGIGVIEAGGLLSSREIADLVETIHQRSNDESRRASGEAANNLDVSQVNCTFYDALGRRDAEYRIARALQFFSPGIPQVYYVGLLAGTNDMELLRRTREGRDINRHYYTARRIDKELQRPVVRALFDLIRFRNTHPAFAGDFSLLPCSDHEIAIEWRSNAHWARLNVDLKAMNAVIDASPGVLFMSQHGSLKSPSNMTAIKALTYMMFAMFAMTTDSVGIIIPEIVKIFRLSLTAAGSFQYATMAGIAVAGFLLGHLADRFGRKTTILVGLMLFAAASFLFLAGTSFLFFCVLMALSGIAIAIFKTGALALIGDIVRSTAEHTSIMNTVEGFFGIGSIVGPALLSQLLNRGVPWQWLYAIAGGMCVLLILMALSVRYPRRASASTKPSRPT